MSTVTTQELAFWPSESRADWQQVDELLKAAQYERVVALLRRAQIENEQIDEAVLISTLAATRQTCLALAAAQAEMEWYKRAYSLARERKFALIEQLYILLNFFEKKGTAEVDHDLMTLMTPAGLKFDLPEPNLLEPAVDHPPRNGQPDLLSGKSTSATPPGLAPTAFSVEPPTRSTLPLILPVEAPAAVFTQAGQRLNSCGLVVLCLGPFLIYQNGHLVEKWNGCKCKSLFKYLLIHRRRPTHCEVLMDLFWPEADPRAARKNLHQAIFNLRQTLQTGCPDFNHILLEDSCYYLNPDLEVTLDSEAFMRHYQTGQQVERQGYLPQAMKEYELADSLYKGEFLAENLYEEWTIVQRENLKRTQLDILNRLSQFYLDQKQFALCTAFCQKLLDEDNCHEEAHRRLMSCYQNQGQRYLALRQYQLCAEAMERELGVLPTPATVELYRQIQGNYVQLSK